MQHKDLDTPPRIEDSYHPLSVSDLDRFETRCNIKLPSDYREFLLEHNGGRFRKEALFVSGREEVGISHFYAIDVPFDWADLTTILSNYRKRGDFTGRLLPVACDGLGNEICLELSNGSVCLWDHETSETVHLVESVRGLLAGIRYPDSGDLWYETEEPFVSAERGSVGRLRGLTMEQLHGKNKRGETPLACACGAGHAQAVQLLIDQGADVNVPDLQGNTPLMLAVSCGAFDVVRTLVRCGADLEARDESGLTALLKAIGYDQVRIALFLIEAGANTEVCAPGGRTAIDYCVNGGAQEHVLPLLLKVQGERN